MVNSATLLRPGAMGSRLGLVECAKRVILGLSGVMEVVAYGSLVRDDFIPGCSDLDIFLVVSEPFLDLARISRALEACTTMTGLPR